ncbi:S8 family serine peptidase [Altibacter sp. HG106]|uniref:S8 family serine peptidase n=1 Tax=Altibacter sp. HG106 TaxID=3023937 RepID=UPI00235075AC|nr:S8 family serine peptidase [Altibacter sp. HG106]MDC7993986.1 S8 family serine peptidase [Altibacter sp. HG106]
MKFLSFLLLILCCCLPAQSQTQDAWVFFGDKEDVATSIANPLTILTQEAIDRKDLHGVPIDERDVPVNEDYIAQVKAANGIAVLAKSKWMNCVYVQGTQANIEDLLNLSFVTEVEYADKDLNFMPGPRNPSEKFEEEHPSRIVYDYGAATNQITMLNGDFLHEQDLTGDGMIVAVLDSGFPNIASIPAFSEVVSEGRLLGTYDFVGRQTDVTGTGSHGTRTFSDIGGLLDGQFVGTAPEASFYLFRTEFSPTEVPVEEAYWVEALERADSLGVDVVNTSLGYQDYDNANYDHSYEDLDGQTTFAARGANHAFDKGMLLVTSAGNDGNGFGTVATPADAPGVLSVGAVDASGNYASFSSRGPTVDGRVKPDIMAQGVDAAVITSSGNVSFSNGTSFSSPISAGAITCLWQFRPETTNAELMQIIRESASLFENPTDEMGYGIPNFEEAYGVLQNLSIEAQQLDANFALYPNPVHNQLMISFPAAEDTALITMTSLTGQILLQQKVVIADPAISVAHFSPGVYILTIQASQKSNTFKIIKQ